MTEFKKISVLGLGYIGLPTAAMFASCKIHVVGVDVKQNVVDVINQGEIHIVETDLEAAVSTAWNEGYLRATTSTEPADAFIIAVPTPFKGNHEPDLQYVKAAAESLAPVLEPGNLVILESTSPVGATEQLATWLADARPDLSFPQAAGEQADINVAHCPERVLPGSIMRELRSNDRVIGGLTDRCSRRAMALYKTFVTGDCILASSPRVAELAKLTENSFRDVNIAFANELSQISRTLDIDVWELISIANRHPRVNILEPGPGVGGHCIAVDPWFIISTAPNESVLIHTARMVNLHKTDTTIDQVSQMANANPERNIICLGLTYKPDIDDLRESPSKEVFDRLRAKYGSRVKAIEPNISADDNAGINTVSIDKAMNGSDIIVLLVGHSEFRDVRPKSDLVIEAVGIWRNAPSLTDVMQTVPGTV